MKLLNKYIFNLKYTYIYNIINTIKVLYIIIQ